MFDQTPPFGDVFVAAQSMLGLIERHRLDQESYRPDHKRT